MSAPVKSRAHGADPWWGEPAEAPTAPAAAPEPPARRRRRSSSRRRTRRGAGWVALGLVLAPFAWLWRRMRASVVMRRLMFRTGVLLAILVVLAGSVGVILINNVVIGRTAELGELDDRRRELRRENALLGARAARLSVPPVVVRRATKDLGMVRSPSMPKFVYLDRDHRTLTPGQRRRIIARNRERLERIAERERAAQRAGTANAPETAAKESAK